MILLSLGTGISAGVILNGQLYRGTNGMAGEVGHAIIEPGGTRCKCGMTGCFETIAAGPAIARAAQEAAKSAAAQGKQTLLANPNPLSAEHVFTAARQGDKAAIEVIRRAARAVSQAIYNLIMHYDVEVVALSGGVSFAGDVFFVPVQEEISRLAAQSPLAREMFAPTPSGEKVILLPREAVPAWKGMITLAKQMAARSKQLI